ncbi:MAG: hypothetical protein NTY00_07310 [Deltaproteobacteria bacterium]|nr:hypothetical protein [Deltaproteobacteria bacterium]
MFTAHDRWSNVLLLTFLSLFFLVSGCVSTENGAKGSEKMQSNILTIKGRVQKISLGEGILVIVPPKGDHVTMKITEKTPVTGGSMKEVEKLRPVRVTYTVEGKQNIAVSIELLPQGSCG